MAGKPGAGDLRRVRADRDSNGLAIGLAVTESKEYVSQVLREAKRTGASDVGARTGASALHVSTLA